MEELIRIRIEELQKLRNDLVAKQKIDLDKIDVRIEELAKMSGETIFEKVSRPSPNLDINKSETQLEDSAFLKSKINNEPESLNKIEEQTVKIINTEPDIKEKMVVHPEKDNKPIQKSESTPSMPLGLDTLIDTIATGTEKKAIPTIDNMAMPLGFNDLILEKNLKDDLIMPDNMAKEMSNDDIEAMLNAQL